MKTVIEMAREANLLFPGVDQVDGSIEQLERFAALVRADEREACAKVCENIDDYDENIDAYYSDTYAAAIRARGEIK